MLLRAAREAGVERIVHVSVSNPSLDSPLGYYRGKAAAEALVRSLGMSYAIVRPTLVVGPHDILVNNIAWFLRRFPLFGMPGSGATASNRSRSTTPAKSSPTPLSARTT